MNWRDIPCSMSEARSSAGRRSPARRARRNAFDRGASNTIISTPSAAIRRTRPARTTADDEDAAQLRQQALFAVFRMKRMTECGSRGETLPAITMVVRRARRCRIRNCPSSGPENLADEGDDGADDADGEGDDRHAPAPRSSVLKSTASTRPSMAVRATPGAPAGACQRCCRGKAHTRSSPSAASLCKSL